MFKNISQLIFWYFMWCSVGDLHALGSSMEPTREPQGFHWLLGPFKIRPCFRRPSEEHLPGIVCMRATSLAVNRTHKISQIESIIIMKVTVYSFLAYTLLILLIFKDLYTLVIWIFVHNNFQSTYQIYI